MTTHAPVDVSARSGFGGTSAYTWLKAPVTENPDDMARVRETSTLPAMLLGGDVGDDQEGAYEKWRGALRLPTVRGPVVGRSLLHPADGDVAPAVDTRWDCCAGPSMTSEPYVPKGGTHMHTTGDGEWTVAPLGGCTVRVEDPEFQIPGRESVFDGVAGFVHASRGARVQIASGAGGRFALAGAKCERRLPARYGPAPEVPDPQTDHGDVGAAEPYRRGGSASIRNT